MAQSRPAALPDDAIVAVTADPPHDPALAAAARRLATRLALPLIDQPHEHVHLLVVVTADQLQLRVLHGEPGAVGGRPVAIDLLKLDTRSPAGARLRQPLLKAMGLRKGAPRPRVLDATAGLGEDTWLLASAGCRVLAVERSEIVAALLEDALGRAATHAPDAAQRVELVNADSRPLLDAWAQSHETALPPAAQAFGRPQVIYLDPMFPAQRRAAERKPMRVLRQLVGQDTDADELLALALAAASWRVVVKRPLRAPTLSPQKPTVVHRGTSVRYDVYVVREAE